MKLEHIIVIVLIIVLYDFINQYKMLYKYHNIEVHYPPEDGPVAISGCSTGLGKALAFLFAEKGYNVIIIGSKNNLNTMHQINNKYAGACSYYEFDFFNPNNDLAFFETTKIQIMINNVACRYGNASLRNISDKMIRNIIVSKPLYMTLITKRMLTNKHNKLIVNICAIPDSCVRTLAIYEAGNAFAHQSSRIMGIAENKRILTLNPGAMYGEKTNKLSEFMSSYIFGLSVDQYAKNVLNLIAQPHIIESNGSLVHYYGHKLTNILPDKLKLLGTEQVAQVFVYSERCKTMKL